MDHTFKIRWLIATKHEDAKRVIETLDYLSFYDVFGLTLLHHSAECGNTEITEFLLEKDCEVNAKDKTGKTPLMLATTNNREKIVKILLEAGADINIKHYGGESAFYMTFSPLYGVSNGIQKLFLKAIDQQFSTSEDKAKSLIKVSCRLYHAIYLKDPAVVEYMLLHGSPVDLKRPTDNKTALHLAIKLGDMKSAMLLLKYGADAKALDNRGSTPLNYLYSSSLETTQEKLDVLQILLNSGVHFAHCAFNDNFQLGPTLMKGNVEAIRTILTHPKLDFAIRDANGMTILHYLALNTNTGIVEEIKFHLDKLAVNALDMTGYTPIVRALGERNIQMAKFLLENGADANFEIRVTPAVTLIHFVYITSIENPNFTNQYDEFFELLLQHKADPEFVVLRLNEPKTIFDFPRENDSINQIRAAIAHVSMLEALGRPITKLALSSINSQRPLKKYLKICRRTLKRKVTRSLRVLDLLTDSKRKMARYINDELVWKLDQLCIKNKVKLDFPYYCNTVERRYWEAREYQQATIAICKIFENRIHEDHLVTRVIMNYLDRGSTRALSQYVQLYK